VKPLPHDGRRQHVGLPACALLLAGLSLSAGDVLRQVPAEQLKKESVHLEPGGSTRGLARLPSQARSPDGRRIARVQSMGIGRESRRSRIVITGPNGRRTTIGPIVNYYGLAWSPDNSKIAFSEGAVVTIADSDGRTRQVVYTGPGGPYPGACFDLVWSEAGRTLSFTQVENAEQLDLSRPTRVVITLGATDR
jgi:dipeptidyl aminopeptidase/acylaminoacyl peptidase